MKCIFNAATCTSDCPKFSMCMYNSLQSQLSEINSQINFVLNILTQVSCESEIQKEHLNIAETNIHDIVSTLIELTNDSETKQNNKESDK